MRARFGIRPLAAVGLALALGATLLVQACSTKDVVAVVISSVTVSPASATLIVGETQDFSVTVRDEDGTVVPGTTVSWSASPSGVLSITPEGRAEALQPGAATVRASVNGVSGTAAVTVQPRPSIAVSPSSVSLFAARGGASPDPLDVQISNGGSGSLTGLAASISYAAGESTGWLSLDLSATTAPTILTITVSSASLAAGDYHATVSITSAAASNSPVELPVELSVTEDSPIIRLTPASVGFAAESGGDPPPDQVVKVANDGGGTVSGLATTISYVQGAGGWLDAQLSSTSAPADLVLSADPSGLAEGSYRASVQVSSPGALNSPRTVTVSFSVSSEPEADLSVTKIGPTSAVVSDTVDFVLTVSNGGPRDATTTLLIDSIPEGFDIVSASGGGVISGRVAMWSLGTVAAGTSVVDTLRAVAKAVGAWVNVGSVASATLDPVTSNNRNTATVQVLLQTAGVSIVKTGPSVANFGDTIEYVLSTANAGPGPAANVVVTDSLPAAVAVVYTSSGGVAASARVVWSMDTLQAGATRSDTLRVEITGTGSLENVARVATTSPDVLTLDNRSTVVTSVGRLADLAMAKTGPDTVAVGDTVRYQLAVSNTGPDSATGVQTVDSLPVGLSFVSASAGGVASGGVVTWSGLAVAPGDTRTDTVVAVATATGAMMDVARVGASTPDPDSTDLRSTWSTVVRGADLSLAKTGPASVAVGDTLTYVLTVTNSGPDTAAAVALTDSLPTGVTFVSASGGGTLTGTAVTWSLGSLAGATASVDTVKVVATATGAKTNIARVTSTTADPDSTDLRAVAATNLTGADLSLTKVAPATAAVGDTLLYELTVTNAGPDAAAGVALVDSLPGGVTFVSATGGGTPSGTAVTWALGAMASGSSVVDTLRVLTTAAGSTMNVARVSSSTADPDSLDRRATATTAVEGADLSVAKTAPASVAVGDTVTYVVTIANAGPDAAAGVALTDSLPAGVTFVSATNGGTLVGTAVGWSKGALASGASTVDTVKAVATITGAIANVARASSGTADPDTTDLRATAATNVAGADLSVTKTGPATVAVGDTLVYVISVANAGPSAAATVTLTDSLPAGVTYASATGGGTLSGTAVTWAKGSLASGSGTVDTVKVVATTTGAKTNVARVSSATADPDTTDLRATASTNLTGADLSVAKTAPATASVLDTLLYVITTTNSGPDLAAAVMLVDSLPAGVTYVSATGGGTLSGTAVSWTKGAMPSGTTVTDTVRVVATTAGVKANVARVASVTADPDTLDRRATASTSVTGADLSVTKSASASAAVGDTVVYVLSVSNAGPDAAVGVVLRDSLPAGLTVASVTNSGSVSGSVVTWSKGLLASGASTLDSVRAVATSTGTKVNVARVSSSTADPDSTDRRSTASTTVSGADLSVIKIAPGAVGVGDTIAYVLETTNGGPDAASSVVLSDSLPAGMTFVSATGGGSQVGSAVVWSVGSVASGVTRTDTLKVVAGATGNATNVARVSSPTADPDSTDRRATAATAVTGADLSLTKSASASVPLGDTIRYVLTLANSGPDAATSVVLTDSLPVGVTFVSATNGGTLSGTAVTWNKGTVGTGAGTLDTVRVLATTTGSKTNIARVSSATADPDAADRRATATTTVTAADLSVTKAAPAAVGIGDTIRYVLTISNSGPSAASAVVLTDSLPAGVTFVSATNGGTLSGTAVTWNKGALASGAGTLDTVKVIASSAGTPSNVARVSSPTADPDTLDRRATASTTVSAADLSVTKSATAAVGVGDTIYYVLTVANGGPDAATGVVLTDSLPAGVTFVSATNGGTLSGTAVTWNKGALASGAGTLDTVKVIASAGGTPSNVARVSSPTADPDTLDRRATASTTVSAADLSVTKSATAAVGVGDTIYYVLTVANGGPDAATGVVLTDSLPAGVTFASATNGGTLSGTAVTWNKGALASGAGTLDTVKVIACSRGDPVQRGPGEQPDGRSGHAGPPGHRVHDGVRRRPVGDEERDGGRGCGRHDLLRADGGQRRARRRDRRGADGQPAGGRDLRVGDQRRHAERHGGDLEQGRAGQRGRHAGYGEGDRVRRGDPVQRGPGEQPDGRSGHAGPPGHRVDHRYGRRSVGHQDRIGGHRTGG